MRPLAGRLALLHLPLHLAMATCGVPLAAQAPAVDCSTRLLGSTNHGELFSVDIATGSASLIGPFEQTSLATEVEYDNNTGTLWAAEPRFGATGLFRVDPTSGATLGSLPTSVAMTGLDFVGSILYAGLGSPAALVTVDTATGTVTNIGATGTSGLSGLAYDPLGDVLYGTTAGSSLSSDLVRVDRTTGVATVIGPLGHNRVGALELGPDGDLYAGVTDTGMTNARFLLRIDPTTAAVTPIGDTGFSITGLTNCLVPPPAIAVPTSSRGGGAALAIALLLLALTWLGRRYTNGPAL